MRHEINLRLAEYINNNNYKSRYLIIIIIYTFIEPWAYTEFYLILDIGNPLRKKTYVKRVLLPSTLNLIYRNNIILS
jgi:hypothetical protein